MRYPALTFLNKLNFTGIPSDELHIMLMRLYAAVIRLQWSLANGIRRLMIVCSCKIDELCDEINRRFEIKSKSDALAHAMAVIEEKANL